MRIYVEREIILIGWTICDEFFLRFWDSGVRNMVPVFQTQLSKEFSIIFLTKAKDIKSFVRRIKNIFANGFLFRLRTLNKPSIKISTNATYILIFLRNVLCVSWSLE